MGAPRIRGEGGAPVDVNAVQAHNVDVLQLLEQHDFADGSRGDALSFPGAALERLDGQHFLAVLLVSGKVDDAVGALTNLGYDVVPAAGSEQGR